MNTHEVYPGAPVVVATVEIRHNPTPPLTQVERRRIKEAICRWAPIQRSAKEMSLQISAGQQSPPTESHEEFPKYFARDSRLAISFKQSAVIVEATRYEGWLEFKAIIDAAVHARVLASSVDAVERIGIRYLNEVRPGGDPTQVEWDQWIDVGLLGPARYASKAELPLSQLQGLAVFGPEVGRSLVLRFTPGEGQGFENQELRRAPGPVGPFMWVDIDSFWLPEGLIPEFDTEIVMVKVEELHGPLRSVFESVISDRLRNEVLRHG